MDDARQKRHTTLVSALAICAAAAAFFAFFPDVSPECKDPKEPQTLASISTDGEGFFGLDEIADFAPLFLPTRRNASAAPRKIPQPAGWDFGKSDSDTPAAALRSPEFLPNAESDMARGRGAHRRSGILFGRPPKSGYENRPVLAFLRAFEELCGGQH